VCALSRSLSVHCVHASLMLGLVIDWDLFKIELNFIELTLIQLLLQA
jgi:hypothetical protein